MLSKSVGPVLSKFVHDLLDHMFNIGLSDSFRLSLVDLSENIPPLLPTIQERLLDMLSIILAKHVYQAPGMERPLSISSYVVFFF
jgi:FKBP12-rapamycin complex-associated protein